MTTEQAPEAQQDQDSGTPAQTVRVPNVSPGAKSGLDHIVIGSDALTPPEDDGEQDEVHDAAWVAAADDSDTAKERADEVFAAAQASGYSEDDMAALSDALRKAVYGDPPTMTGETVESETAGTGEATNAETGETTPGGEQLPDAPGQTGEPIEQGGTGPEPSEGAPSSDQSDQGPSTT